MSSGGNAVKFYEVVETVYWCIKVVPILPRPNIKREAGITSLEVFSSDLLDRIQEFVFVS